MGTAPRGGGGYSSQMLLGMCHGKVKNGGWGSGSSSSVRVGSPELTVGRICMLAHSDRQLTPGRCPNADCSKPAVGGGERVEIKDILKWWSPERQKKSSGYAPEWIFGHLWKWYAPDRNFRTENGGLSLGAYPICIQNGSPPPPGIL